MHVVNADACLKVEVIYQAQERVFHQISKPGEESWKYESIFEERQNTLLSVWYILSIKTKSTEKTER